MDGGAGAGASDLGLPSAARGAVRAVAAAADEAWQRLPTQEQVLDAAGGWLQWPYVLVPVAVGAAVWWGTGDGRGRGRARGGRGVRGRGPRGAAEWEEAYGVYG